jgi:hypothetical protein
MAKVYVSSTVADLEQERRAVLDWLRLARHQAVDSYLPGSETVQDSCLDDVGTCDLYVLIVGHRYGSVPADDNPEGLSITQLEFRRAGECHIPRVALLRTSIPDVSLSDMEDPSRAGLVLAFREEVKREVRPAEFRDLEGLTRGLSTGIQGELDKLAKRPAGQAAAGRVLRLAPRPEFLAGREDLLAELDARLTAGDGGRPQVVALSGLGGTGKTSLAVEYAHRHLDEVGLVWQFPAEDTEVLLAEFGRLAAQLGAREVADARDPVASVHSALAAYPAGWLLIFDNAPGPGPVRAFVPPVGNGQVLITSQSAVWPRTQAVEVPVLDTEVAAEFLVTRTGDTDQRAARDLVGELGGLPLALEQAAAYTQATATTLAEYLALFQDRRADLLARGDTPGHPAHVAATLGLALSRLQGEAPAAAGLLRLLAFYAPEAIPLRLLLQPRPGLAEQLAPEVAGVLVPLLEDELAAGDAVAALRRYSLVRRAGDGAVSVHRLVQGVTADQMPDELRVAWRQAAAVLAEAAIPADTDQPATWPVCAVLLPHARVVLGLTSGGMHRIANYLVHSGSNPAAWDLFQLIADAYSQAYGPEHRKTLSARDTLAFFTGSAGDAAGARDQHAALLPIRERVQGPEDPGTLWTRGNLAYWTGEAGDAAGARDQYAGLLVIEERVLGPEHRFTLRDRNGLARFTGQAGDAAGARDQYAALLAIEEQERVRGPEHPDTLRDRGNLAWWTGEAGDAAGARDQYAALLPIEERVLGLGHPDTQTTRRNLAHWTNSAEGGAGAG